MTTEAVNDKLVQKLVRTLNELPNAYQQLHWYWLPGNRPTDTGSIQRHSVLDTRTPITLDVLDLTDERHKADAELVRDNYELDKMAGNRRLGILPTLSQWVRLVDAELWDNDISHSAPAETPTVDTECSWLQGHIDWMTQRPWFPDLVDDATKMLADVHRVVGSDKPVHLICTQCGWGVYEQEDGSYYKCSGCQRAWSRIELHRMAERKKPKTLAEIATITNISLKTLRVYADKGYLKPVARDGQASLYDLDAVSLATMNLRYKRMDVKVA